jgi:nitrogen fixation NifU-like protein
MGELRDLYQEVILDHSRAPRNLRRLPDADGHADGHNPLCGDRLTVFLRRSDERIADVSFEGSGCAISLASASMMTEALRGRTLAEAERIFTDFHALVTGKLDPALAPELLGKLAVFSGVREFPVRVKCATLSWHTLRAALAGVAQPVSTEGA